ncbi:uncharacterized protein K460DRAFT_391228 [Cucurbitaria berberidis CBS 394.84]|uniref:Ricin B lectin domain-containing protein n=1 Tax=Cucurbitaria berberidis CBS 394.84 TaxID=1168544 RepID=A0A9P4GQG0_9PLEO|nr:uncharacterized protein K460DRAFT_391228 [Cucurbitaria berberidis CBS 394.84]KAF1850818.1 hypothetical protein K460DRAFT_391228 [Cucurbitaria berberidis CBS 394.84]
MSKILSPFDPKSYYRFSNAAYAGVTISTGYKHSSSSIIFTPSGSRSSENWQIFRQGERYFIRNYDYGAELQLGLTKASDAVPRLLPRSGELGQQWNLDQNEDGSWRVTNALLGNISVLGVSDAISSHEIAPAMNPSPDESKRWIVTVNLSAGQIWQPGMLNDVLSPEVPQSAASTIPSTSAASNIPPIFAASTISSLAMTSNMPSTTAAPNITSPVTTSSRGINTTAYFSDARPMHSPPRLFACTISSSHFAITTVILSLVTAALIWRRRPRSSYHPIIVLDVALGVDTPLIEK